MSGRIIYSIIDTLKTNKVLQPIYGRLKNKSMSNMFSINSSRNISFSEEENTKVRISLVLPTLRKTKVYGGINTAINFFHALVECYNADGRILVLNDENGDSRWMYPISGYSTKNDNKHICFLPQLEKVSVRKNEIIILTSWRTAFTFLPLLQWKIDQGDKDFKFIYFIQDYEPGFFAWSTEYALAELTYLQNPESMVAIINSKQLYDFFSDKGYCFFRMMYFEPVLNERLKIALEKADKSEKRRKQIIIYGRPSENRNAFEIVRYSLQEWSRKYSAASEWTVVSLGENFEDIKLPNNTIYVKGKVSLEEYASIMLESYAGLSLMVSPHPSYPPLEMSTFGVRTITNCYENKDLRAFNDNIISLPTCSPDLIIESLCKICDEYDSYISKVDINASYLKNDSMELCINEIQEIWKKK